MKELEFNLNVDLEKEEKEFKETIGNAVLGFIKRTGSKDILLSVDINNKIVLITDKREL